MTEQRLNSLQVAALLVSASCGIGFLFGSGELALRWSMAGSIYAVSTAAGMFILAGFAKSVWKAGGPIWDVLGKDYGSTVAHGTAILSVVWLLGVLAAQILGGVAILQIFGISEMQAFAAMSCAMFVASQVSLSRLSSLFSASLLGSLAILIYAIAMVHGGDTYARAIDRFAVDIKPLPPLDTAVAIFAVIFVVVTGADYQQFILAAKDTKSAVLGSFLAAAFLMAAGFLPATAVVSWQDSGRLHSFGNSAGVVPFIVAHAAENIWHFGAPLVLLLMLLAALGSGGAITRATAAALSTLSPSFKNRSKALAIGTLAMATGVAWRGGGIVHSIVGLNIVFIASIAVLLACRRTNPGISPRSSFLVMFAGFLPSAAIYLSALLGAFPHHADAWSLMSGLIASTIVWLTLQRRNLRLA